MDIKKPCRRRCDGSPVFESVVKLPQEDSGLQHSIVRVDNSNVRFYGRRTPVAIYNLNGNRKKWILRYVMGNNGRVKGLTKRALAIDYDGMCELDLSLHYGTENLVMRKATTWQCILWLANSTDLNTRLSTRLGLLGAVLGMVGLVIGCISLV